MDARIVLRLPAVLFLLLGLGALASIAFVRGYPLALATFLLAGIGFGGVYLLMIALLSRTESPNRSFGWQWGLGSLPGVLLLYAIPSFITVTDTVRPVFELIVAAIVFIGLATFVLTFGTGIISMWTKADRPLAFRLRHLVPGRFSVRPSQDSFPKPRVQERCFWAAG